MTPATIIDLCRLFCLSDRLLGEVYPARTRALAMAEIAHRHHHPLKASLPSERHEQLGHAYDDWRIATLHHRQRQMLIFATAGALALVDTDPDAGNALLASALALCNLVSIPSEWREWEGRRRIYIPRVPIQRIQDREAPLDPSGDPEDELEPTEIEPLSRLPTPSAWSSAADVLDRLDPWGAVVRDHLYLPIGEWHAHRRLSLLDLIQADPYSSELIFAIDRAVAVLAA